MMRYSFLALALMLLGSYISPADTKKTYEFSDFDKNNFTNDFTGKVTLMYPTPYIESLGTIQAKKITMPIHTLSCLQSYCLARIECALCRLENSHSSNAHDGDKKRLHELEFQVLNTLTYESANSILTTGMPYNGDRATIDATTFMKLLQFAACNLEHGDNTTRIVLNKDFGNSVVVGDDVAQFLQIHRDQERL